MEIFVPHSRTKKVEMPLSADITKAFEKYYKNSVIVNVDNESKTPDILIYSWLMSFANSEEFKNMEAQAEAIKAEEKAEKERAKAEKAKAKAERAKSKEVSKAEEIAKLEARLAKLKEEA